jgi:hypothetical protein
MSSTLPGVLVGAGIAVVAGVAFQLLNHRLAASRDRKRRTEQLAAQLLGYGRAIQFVVTTNLTSPSIDLSTRLAETIQSQFMALSYEIRWTVSADLRRATLRYTDAMAALVTGWGRHDTELDVKEREMVDAANALDHLMNQHA